MKTDIKPPSEIEFRSAANAIVWRYAPRIYACKKCGWPVASGYCCGTCGDGNPSEPAELDKASDAAPKQADKDANAVTGEE